MHLILKSNVLFFIGPVFKLFSWIMLYSLSIFVCLNVLLFYKLYGDYKYFVKSDTIIFNLLHRISGSSLGLICFILPIFWTDMKNIPKYWDRWNIFQVCRYTILSKIVKIQCLFFRTNLNCVCENLFN